MVALRDVSRIISISLVAPSDSFIQAGTTFHSAEYMCTVRSIPDGQPRENDQKLNISISRVDDC